MILYFNFISFVTQYEAARAWTMWEMKTAHLIPNEDTIKRGENDDFSLVSYIGRGVCFVNFYEVIVYMST